MEEYRFEVVVNAHEDTPVSEHIREFLSQLDSVSGIVEVRVGRTNATERDISEVHHILGDLSQNELEKLYEAIDTYTEEK